MRVSRFAALALLWSPSLAAQTPAPAMNLQFATPIPGGWSYAPAADGGEAVFRDSSARAQLMLHCTRSARRVTISKPASSAAAAMVVWTTGQSRSLPAGFDATSARLNAALSAYDQFLDQIAFSRGRLAVSVAGSPALVVAPWPEIARLIEDCRS